MRELSINEVEEVNGGIIATVIIAVIQIGTWILTNGGSSSGSSATAANGATVDCGDGKEATATATTATCK